MKRASSAYRRRWGFKSKKQRGVELWVALGGMLAAYLIGYCHGMWRLWL